MVILYQAMSRSSAKRQVTFNSVDEELGPSVSATPVPSIATSKRQRTSGKKKYDSTSPSSSSSSTVEKLESATAKVSASIYDGSWNTLYEDYLDNKDKSHVIEFLVDQFVYFGLPLNQRSNLIHFITMISHEYHNNVYHNFTHACHVTLNCCYFLSKLTHPEDFTNVEKLSLLFSAIIHDAGHLGVSNYALINKNHDLAKKYHDQSVAEMHSLTLGLEGLQQGDHALIQHFNADEKRLFRKFMIELVLGTDIADPYKKKMAYDRIDELSNANSGELPISLSTHDSKMVLMVLILRASDVGSSMQSVHTSQIWAKNFYLETKLASFVGDAPHIEPNHCHITQINYFERHSQFLVKKLIRTNGIVDTFTTQLLHNVDANIQSWKKQGFALIREWDADPLVANSSKQVAEPCIELSTNNIKKTQKKGSKKMTPISEEDSRVVEIAAVASSNVQKKGLGSKISVPETSPEVLLPLGDSVMPVDKSSGMRKSKKASLSKR